MVYSVNVCKCLDDIKCQYDHLIYRLCLACELPTISYHIDLDNIEPCEFMDICCNYDILPITMYLIDILQHESVMYLDGPLLKYAAEKYPSVDMLSHIAEGGDYELFMKYIDTYEDQLIECDQESIIIDAMSSGCVDIVRHMFTTFGSVGEYSDYNIPKQVSAEILEIIDDQIANHDELLLWAIVNKNIEAIRFFKQRANSLYISRGKRLARAIGRDDIVNILQ